MQEKEKDNVKAVCDTEDIHHLVSDLLFGILRDWAFISAGKDGAWTRTRTIKDPENYLQKVLKKIEIERMETRMENHMFGSQGTPRNEGDRRISYLSKVLGSADFETSFPNGRDKMRKIFSSTFLNPVLQAGM